MTDIGNLPIIGRAWAAAARPRLTLSAAQRLVPARWVRRLDATRCELVLGGPAEDEPWEVLTLGGRDAVLVFDLLGAADGQRSLAALAQHAGTDLGTATELMQNLYQRGIVLTEGDTPVPALGFYEHMRAVCRYTLQHWGPSPMLARFWNGPVTRRLALGYLLENWHFAAAASSHQGAAVASMPSLRLKTAYSEHLSIEYWHYAWLQRGLNAAGLDARDLERASPITTTLAQINQLRFLAQSDPAAYALCMGVGEGDPLALASVQRFWERFGEHAVLPEAAYAPFREHDLGDCQDDHESFGSELFCELGTLSAAEQVRIRQRVLAYCRVTWEHHHALLAFYGASEGPAYFCLED